MKKRRSFLDYSPEVARFETYLEMTTGKTIREIDSVQELLEILREWFEHIEIPKESRIKLAKQMLKYISEQTLKPRKIARYIARVARPRAPWLEDELKVLRTMYPRKVPVSFIAKLLGRSKRAVYVKASRLGLRRR